jgi:hypothetical protein
MRPGAVLPWSLPLALIQPSAYRRGILGTSGVEFLEVRLLAFYRVFAREFARGKLEATI